MEELIKETENRIKEIIDHPGYGLKEHSNTNKIRHQILAISEQSISQAVSHESRRVIGEINKIAKEWDDGGNTGVQLALHDVISAVLPSIKKS